eukprot:2575545-Rhodomonas_salina.1
MRRNLVGITGRNQGHGQLSSKSATECISAFCGGSTGTSVISSIPAATSVNQTLCQHECVRRNLVQINSNKFTGPGDTRAAAVVLYGRKYHGFCQ